MKRISNMILVFLIVGLLSSVAAGAEHVIRLGHGTAVDSLYHFGAEAFKRILEDKTNGEIRVDIYPGGGLGHDRDLTEGMQLGTIEMGVIGTEPLTTFAPTMAVINLPYLFRDREHAYAVLDGEIGDEIMEPLEKQGIMNLAWFENGFRNVTNSARPIKTPSDLKGLKIRTPNSPVSLAIFEALGANPIPMNFGEVYTALQQRTIDGQENPLALIHSSRFHEVNKHISLTKHIYSPCVLLISKQFFSRLPENHQQSVIEAAIEARDLQRQESIKREQMYVDSLVDEGAIITEPNFDSFVEATGNVWRQFAKSFGEELYLRIKDFPAN